MRTYICKDTRAHKHTYAYRDIACPTTMSGVSRSGFMRIKCSTLVWKRVARESSESCAFTSYTGPV